jgi:hypothetical protein
MIPRELGTRAVFVRMPQLRLFPVSLLDVLHTRRPVKAEKILRMQAIYLKLYEAHIASSIASEACTLRFQAC